MYKPNQKSQFGIKNILFILIFSILFYEFFIKEESVSYGSGTFAPLVPKQKKVTSDEIFEFKKFKFTKLASYNIKAKVLSRKDYSDFGAVLSPTDLALGWGSMSNEDIIKDIKISQSGRWYNYKYEYKYVKITPGEIAINSANTHIIPANDEVNMILSEVIKGNIVEMNGYLVSIEGKNNFRWRSSTSRKDTGGGACEVFYVENLTVVQP